MIERLPDEQAATPREPGKTGIAQDTLDGADTEVDAFLVENFGDLAAGHLAQTAQFYDVGADVGWCAAMRSWEVRGTERKGELSVEEAMAEDVDVCERKVEALGDGSGGKAFEEASAERLVVALAV